MSHFQELSSAKYLTAPVEEETPRTSAPAPSQLGSFTRILDFLGGLNPMLLKFLVVPFVIGVLALAFGQTEKSKFDRLEIGMSTSEVEAILRPKRGKWAAMQPNLVEDNLNLNLNGQMIIIMRDGRLVHKELLGDGE